MPSSLSRSLAVTGIAGCVAASGTAAEWSVGGFFSERVEGVTESGGEDPGNGFRSLTDLGVSFQAQSPTTTLILAPGVRALLSSVSDQPSEVRPRFNGSLLHRAPRSTVTASLLVVPTYVDDTQFDEASQRTDRNVLQITASGRLGMSYLVDPRNSVSAGLFGRVRDFVQDTDSVSPSQSWGVDGGWSRTFSPAVTGTLTPSLTFFSSDSNTGSDGETFSLRAGFSREVNPRLEIEGSIGPSVTRSSRPGSNDEINVNGVGSLGLVYSTEDTRYSLGLNQSVDQNSDGEIENRTTLRGGVGYNINEVSRLNLSSTAGLQRAISGDEEDRLSFTITPSYSYNLTEDWSLDLGYRFRASDQDDLETSSTVFLQISRGLSFLP